MLQGIHTLASLEDGPDAFDYNGVQVAVCEGLRPHRDTRNMGRPWTISRWMTLDQRQRWEVLGTDSSP
eukprot:12904230-Prorocentrum_lima.AAC.1